MLFRSPASLFPRALFLTLASLPAVSFSAEIGGTTVNSNTTLSDGDTWDGANGDFTINDGAVVNIPTGATVVYSPDGNRNLLTNAGGGTLQIDTGGVFAHTTDTGGDNLIFNGAVALLNNGTYEFASGGDIQLKNNGSSFTNNGTILKSVNSLSSSNDPTYIFPNGTTSGGTFLNTGDLTVNAGHLSIGGGSSTGGNFSVSGGGVLSFVGRWTELTGVADDSGGGLIIINDENPAGTTGGKFVADAATTVLNVTGTGLGFGTSVVDLNGNILRNDGVLNLAIDTVTVTVEGAGSFENSSTGTFNLQDGTLALTTSDLTNNGLLAIANGTTTVTGTGSIVNSATGTITLGPSGALIADTAVINNGQMDVSGGARIGGSVAVTNSATGTLSLIGGSLNLDGNNLVNDGTAEFATVDGNVTLTGTGRFINNNVFNHKYGGGNDNQVISGTAVFENNGTFDFKDRGDIQVTSGTFENNGLLVKSGAGSDPSYVFRDSSGLSSSFIAAAGSEVRSNAGILHIATGGTSDAAAVWTADGGDIHLAGLWTGTVTGSSTNGGKIRINESGNGGVASDLVIGTGGFAVDVSGDGTVWNARTINTQGNTFTNEDIFFIAGTGTKALTGGGELLNASGASLIHNEGTVTFADNSILRNQGAMEIPSAGGTAGYVGAGSLINDTGGTLAWTGGEINVGTGFSFNNKGTMNISGGSHLLAGDGIFSNDTGGITNWNNSSTISIDTGATYTNNGTFNTENDGNRTFSGTGTFVNNGTFNHNINAGNDNVGWDGAGEFVNNGVFAFNSNNDFNMSNGSTFTNAAGGKIQVNSVGTDQAQFFSFDGSGTGTLDNQGTVEVLSGHFRLTTSVADAQFDDNQLVQNNGSGTLTGGTWVADSTATGAARIDLQPFGASSGINTIGSNAVVDLTGGGATLTQMSSLSQVDGGLYISDKTFTPTGTLTVGSTGTLGGNGVIANNTTVDGTVTPGAARGSGIGALSITGNLGLNSTSKLNLQLTAALGVQDSSSNPVTTRMMIDSLSDMDPTTEHDSLEVSGVLTLSNLMSIQVTDAGMTYAYGQYFDLLDFASLDGITTQAEADAILDLPDLGPSYTWDTSLFVSKGIIFVVPEPSHAMLFLTGMVGLLVRRKRTS